MRHSAVPARSAGRLPHGPRKKKAAASSGRLRYYLTLTSLISNCTATFGGNGVRGSAP